MKKKGGAIASPLTISLYSFSLLSYLGSNLRRLQTTFLPHPISNIDLRLHQQSKHNSNIYQ
jgi:hypothetical protein